MKRKQSKVWEQRYLLAAFAIPFLGMCMVMIVNGFVPFGKTSMLYSDMYHQYYPFFVQLRRALRSGDGLMYTWSVGLGMDYMGLISYYLASPLNLLGVLVPEGWTLEYFSLMMPVKLGCAGLFFAIFLRGIFDRNDLSISIFGGFYGLCAWALAYQWNIMWLDSFALLPLVALGAVSLLRDKKCILYTLTLFLSIFANYYIGLFVCIFVALLFFCYQICRWQGWKRFFRDLGRIALFSALAIGMSAILELPALAALQNTQSSVNKFPTTFRLNIASTHNFLGLLEGMRKVAGNMGGSLEPSFKEGLPNLYCGVGSLVLAILYLMGGDIKLRDKLCCLFLLLFFNVSFIIRQLDYIWHGFHFTNMIPYRFSFLHCFVLLYMAYRAWLIRRKFRPLELGIAAVAAVILLCCSEGLLNQEKASLFGIQFQVYTYILYNGAFLLVFLAGLLYGMVKPRLAQDAPFAQVREARIAYHQRQVVARVWLLGAMGLELAATLLCFGLYFPGTNVSNYPRGTEAAESMIRYMHEREEDTLFFRAEVNHSQSLNDGALNGYNGVSAFTSSANVKVTEFMKALGYGAKNTYNRYCYEESSPVADLFLGIKYTLEREGKEKESAFWTDVHHYGDVHLLENNYYLPLGFLVRPELAMIDFGGGDDSFHIQNDIFSNATGIDRQVWRRIPPADLEVAGEGVTVTEVRNNGNSIYKDAGKGSYISYRFRVQNTGFMCVHLNFPKRNDFLVIVNGVEKYKETISLPQMIAVGDVTAGDLVEIRVLCDKGESSNVTVTGAVLDNELFREGYALLAECTWELTSFESTALEGTIQCSRDGLMYTSIPQNGNWAVTVDGKEAQTALVGDAMIGVYLTEGKHTVAMRYENKAFSLGWKVTALCLLAFVALVPVYYPQVREKIKKRIRK